jgi:hypothetical protein
MSEIYSVFINIDLKVQIDVPANSEEEAIETAESIDVDDLLKAEIVDVSTVTIESAYKK